jgi:hypothetical protein
MLCPTRPVVETPAKTARVQHSYVKAQSREKREYK